MRKKIIEISTKGMASKKEFEGNLFIECKKMRVLKADKYVWTDIIGGGKLADGFGDININSQVKFIDQVFCVDDSGNEHFIELEDVNFAAREGHILEMYLFLKMVFEVVQTEPKSIECLAVFNHSINKFFYDDKNILKRTFIKKSSLNEFKKMIKKI